MMKLACVLLTLGLASAAGAAVTSVTAHGPESTSLNDMIQVGDVLSGLIGTELAGGWHPAVSDPADKMPALTDDAGIRGTGLTGLLNDFPGAGNPAKVVQYDLAAATDIARIGILSGNNGKDGRVFSTTVVQYSTDNGQNFATLGYFQSDPSGTLNAGPGPIGSTYVDIYDDAGAALAAGVTNLQFLLYAVDNTGGQMRDPYEGVNPYTGIDDTYSAAFVSPLIFELDAVAVPEPATLCVLAVGALLLGRRRA